MKTDTQQLLARLHAHQAVFADVLAHIDARFDFSPTAFDNNGVQNELGQNSGSCRVFAFAAHEGLSEGETLQLFAEHYAAVLAAPQGQDHANIRAFLQYGWVGVKFAQTALTIKV